MLTRRRRADRYGIQAVTIALALLVVGGAHCHRAPLRPYPSRPPGPEALGRTFQWPDPPDEMERFAAADPLSFLKRCREHYFDNVADYRCLFTMQELNDGVVSPEQGIEIHFREKPFSVRMDWVKNPGPASRVSYVASRWTRDGRELALIKPSGVLGWLVPGGVKRYIHAADVLAASRRPIDRFGFLNTLELIIHYCRRAKGHPQYDLRYVGRGLLDDRPCYVFERRLPYTGPDGPYPDRLLTCYIDRQWLVPTGCISYLDDAMDRLLGRYILTNVQFNVGLTDEDF